MLVHFVRLIVGAVVKLLVLSFTLFYMLIETPGGARDLIYQLHPTLPHFRQFIDRNLNIDRPWPLNYVTWLFDPVALKLSGGEIYTQASGALVGDFGHSIAIDIGKPVVDMFGPGIDKMFAFLTTLIAMLMALVVAQRWRRPQPYRVSTLPTASALVDWWQLHSRSPLDVAIIDRQWA